MSVKMTNISVESLRPVAVLYEGDIHELACLLLKMADAKDREANSRMSGSTVHRRQTLNGLATYYAMVSHIDAERVKEILVRHGLPLGAVVEHDDAVGEEASAGSPRGTKSAELEADTGEPPSEKEIQPHTKVTTMAKKKQEKRWLLSPPSRTASPTQDADSRALVEAKVRELIDKVLKPKHVKPPREGSTSNYVTDITLKWHGSTLFLVSVYACPGPNAIAPKFEDRFARVKPAGGGRFDLAFMRYTGQWVSLHHGITLDQCMAAIRDDPWFMP